MPGQRRARIIRKEILPADLRKAMKAEVKQIAQERASKSSKANTRYAEEESKARIARNNTHSEAWEEFDAKRADIVSRYETLAAERRETAA